MLQIKRDLIVEKWFCQNVSIYDAFLLVSYVQVENASPFFRSSKKRTLHINLDQTLEKIFNSFSKNTRYEIRRAERDGIQFAPLSITKEEYRLLYNDFAKTKDLVQLQQKDIEYYWQNLKVFGVKKEDEIVALHSYLCDEKRARLFHSISLFRVDQNLDKNFVGRANRFLHFKAIEHFQKEGFKIYDFGGVTTFENSLMNGIDRFKFGFGGEKVIEYNLLSYPLWILIHLKRLYGKVIHSAR